VGVAGFGVGFLPGSILTCAATRSDRDVNAANPALINSDAQVIKTEAFIAFGSPPADDVDLENERLVAPLLRGNDSAVAGRPGLR
jgi:hypothetical protein